MRKPWKRIISILLAVLMLAGALPAWAAGEEPDDFPQTDSPMLSNTTDSSRLPVRTAKLSDVYGQVDATGAEEMDTLFTQEARDRFAKDLDRILDFRPVEDATVAPVLGKVEGFLSAGGLSAYLRSGNLQAGAGIGLCGNRDDKVKVLGTDANASAWVYVVDKDAMCFVVQDQEGMGIPHALVTISYLDDSGKRITRSVVATAGNTPGIAAFDELPDVFYGLVDIQAEGYRAVSVLDKRMESGERYTLALEKARENDLYLRGVDLSGKDMVNEETTLSLMSRDTGDLSLKVIVSKTGTAAFPDSIQVYSENRGAVVLTIGGASGYDYDSNTRVYTAEKRWAEQQAGLLRENDRVSVRLNGEAFPLEHLTVENAVFDDLGAKKTDMPVTTKPMPGEISDRLGGTGLLNITAQVLQVPVTVGFFPDGNVIIMASYDITQLDKNTQYKYNSLFEKSWNPKTLESTDRTFQVFERSFWENAKKVKGGKAVLESKDKIKCLTNKNYNFSMSFSVFLRSCWNKETQDLYGSGGILFSGSLTGGITEYFLFTAGPVVIPAYVGFEAGFAVNAGLNVNFATDKPPAGEENDAKWKYANNGDTDLTARIEFIVSFSVFGGVGVKGIMGVGATGYANMDIATVLGKGNASMLTADPHSFIDVLYGLRFDYYLLFYSGSIKLDCLNGAKRIYDSQGETDQLLTEELPEIEFRDLDLSACGAGFVPALSDDPHSGDRAYQMPAGNTLDAGSSIMTIDGNTYPDGQAQFVATKNYTALFRLASDGQRTHLIYQYQEKGTGNLSGTFYLVTLPEGETRSISEFVAVPNKTNPDDPSCCDKVYIGAILADNTQGEAQRMRSTDVAAIVVDLDQHQTTSAVLASDPEMKGQVLYSAPMPAGREDYCSVAYAATGLAGDDGETVTTLRSLLGTIPTRTNYWLSSCQAGDPENRSFTNLGTSKVHSTGVITPNEPSYWMADRIQSTDKTLVAKGYGANGYYAATDPRCHFRIDIDGILDPEDMAKGDFDLFDPILTNWQYINGCNYFIAGDSVYAMNRKARESDPADYQWSAEKVEGGAGIVSADNRYAMITNNDQSAVYLISVVGDYTVNMEEGAAAKADKRVQIYTLTRDRNGTTGEENSVLHGPLALKFAGGEPVTYFAAAYDPGGSSAKGLTLVYSTPRTDDPTGSAAMLRMWKQNADRGLGVTDVKIPDYLIREGQPYIDLYVTVKNYGYTREGVVSYTIHDEAGDWFTQYINGYDVGQPSYSGTDLYTGDSRVDKIQIKPNPKWRLNEEHELIVEVTEDLRYNGSLDDVGSSGVVKADNTSLSAENTLIGGRHFVSATITNNTIIGQESPVIQGVFRYADSGKEKTMQFRLPTGERLYQYDPERTEAVPQAYHYDIDMDRIWADGLEEGLLGISFSLVDAQGAQVSNEVIYVTNPEETARPAHDGSQAPAAHSCPSEDFADVDPQAWYHEAVDYAVEHGLMRGVSDTAFAPGSAMTRAMAATILHRLEGEPAVGGASPFSDVTAQRWFADGVLWAGEQGIVLGYPDGRFGPTDRLTREQLAVILFRYARYKGYPTGRGADLSGYEDRDDIHGWALEAMEWANGEGLITGRTATTLVPGGTVTRAEGAVILTRLMERETNG